MSQIKKGNLENILRSHDLKSTPQREALLKAFMESDKAMNLTDINKYSKEFDRMTLYRNLNAFEEKGLIHKIPDKEIPSYALCKHDSIKHSHQDEHVHFKCINCELTLCLDNIEIPEI